MPIDPSIALAGKPVDIKPVDWNNTFKTLAQMRYLGAETQAAEEKATRDQALFGEQGAAGAYLSSLGKGSAPTVSTPATQPQPAQTLGGLPFDQATLGGLKQGEITPPSGTPVDAGPGQAPAA